MDDGPGNPDTGSAPQSEDVNLRIAVYRGLSLVMFVC